jgi:anaphase-promoting complex subunit 2
MSVLDADAADQSFQHDDDDDQERTVSLGAHEEEEMKVYESYIFGMLKNLGQLPLDRIHSMLKTFVAGSDHRYDKTPQQLAVFLQQLCREEKLEFSPDGYYTLVQRSTR